MFDLEKEIKVWRQHLASGGINSPAALDELESHLRERIGRLGAGLSAEESFQIAARELGEASALKREFAKAGRLSFWNWRENPTALKVAAVWLILMGLNAVSQIVWLAIFGFNSSAFFLAVISLCLLYSLQIPIGIGLLRHVSLSRYCAFFLLGAKGLSAAFSLCFYALHVHDASRYLPGHDFILMGLPVPIRYTGLWDLLALVISVFAIWVLSRPEIREHFRAGREKQSA